MALGIASVFDNVLEGLSKDVGFSGTICTLGVMDIEDRRDPRTYFSALGFGAVESMDFSDYEGADLIFDLNEATLPAELSQRYDAVFNGGTLEHVFHVPNALASITNMLKLNGIVFHILPCNGWVNHGFYQFSPTLMFDYYEAAGFEPLSSLLCSYDTSAPGRWMVTPMRRNDLAESCAGAISDGRVYLYFFLARRSPNAIDRPCPVQGVYSGKASADSRIPWFIPYEVQGGVKREPRIETRTRLTSFEKERGCCWVSLLPELGERADCVKSSNRSPLILLEDGQALGPAHSTHDAIRERGGGAFSHWNAGLYFSTSDNTDPTTNQRIYEVLIL